MADLGKLDRDQPLELVPDPGPTPIRSASLPFLCTLAAVLMLVATVLHFIAPGENIPKSDAVAGPTPPSPIARPAAIEIECQTIGMAHNAWAGSELPAASPSIGKFDDRSIKIAARNGEKYLNAVKGHNGQQANELATAITDYNAELALAASQMARSLRVSRSQATKIEQRVATVVEKYQAWRAAMCT
ncbi:hypothetical protein [Micromonospora tulbaghiae]|uniref:hypothetical protein n=1 Tax=Micromonospora tulbaghiae TaxID=479978 RepID=UPI0013C4928A|nr:hypothetical protein [Micromonospora tulbaghiae]